ncbi:MAG: NAD/NADP octopine/nopaline dehydrogenase [Rhodospirillaceae bacterium]|nr:NAD/NADP octopine/nopaline dehydrogenase [Rhodospirillaceae bacterium]|tara:strand:- start:5946 stop:7049 length:1104 start_codon:yes stop_codon:yes gene_type:complete
MTAQSIAILGAGHGGCAAAADLTARGFEVRLHARREETLQPLVQQGGVQAAGVQEGLFPVALLTTDVAEAISGADIIMLVVPSVAHGYYAQALAPIVTQDIPVFVNPGHTGGALHFVSELRKVGYKAPIKTCETVTLTYICRKTGPAAVDIFSYTKKLKFAAFPGKYSQEMFELVRPLYPEITLVSSVLETALTNINAVFHAPGMLMNVGWIEDTGGDFLFYREGITPAVGRVIAELDTERMAVADALGVPTASFLENFYQAGLTTKEAMESGDVSRACVESEPNWKIKSPPSLDHRYIHEDVGYGLVPFAGFGRLAGVPTPTIDALIHLTSEMMNIPYTTTGLTLEAMGLSGLDAKGVLRFVEEGV